MSAGASPRWIAKDALVILHDRSLALHGGRPGVGDEGLLESALARPVDSHAYEGVDDIAALAANYAAAISSNHPFVDGNKRTALLAAAVFLEINGLRLIADAADATLVMLQLAAGDLDIAALTAWIRANATTPPADRSA